jgi:hypothetical protein
VHVILYLTHVCGVAYKDVRSDFFSPLTSKEPPMHVLITARKVSLNRPLGALIRKQLKERLQRFGAAIVAAEVRLSDRNGRRGGADKRCRIAVRLARGGAVVREEVRADPRVALAHALSRVESAIRRDLRTLNPA